MAWDDSPPTKEELALIESMRPTSHNALSAPPSPEEMKALGIQAPSPSILDRLKSLKTKEPYQDFASTLSQDIGGAQVAGAAQSLPDIIQSKAHKLLPSMIKASPSQVNDQLAQQGFTGDVGPTSSGQMYAEGRGQQEQKYAKAHERSPVAAGLGELTGGVAGIEGTLGLAGATGATAAAGEMASKVPGLSHAVDFAKYAKQAPGVAEAYNAGGLLPAAESLGTKALGNYVEGAPIGAAQQAIASPNHIVDASPEERQAYLQDIIHGANTGGLVGGGISLASDLAPLAKQGLQKAGEAIKGKVSDTVGNVVENNPTLRQAGMAYDVGKEGDLFGNQSTMDKMAAKKGEATQNLFDLYKLGQQKVGQYVQKSISDASSKGVTVPVTPNIQSATSKVQELVNQFPSLEQTLPGQNQDILTQLYKNQSIDPQTAYRLRQSADDMFRIFKGDPSAKAMEAKQAILGFRNAISDNLKQAIPEYRAASANYEQYQSMFPETIVGKGDPDSVFLGNSPNSDKKVKTGISNMLENSQSGKAGKSMSYLDTLNQLKANLKQMGVADSVIADTVSKPADMMGMQKKAYGQGISSGLNPLKASNVVKGANVIGKGVNVVGNMSKKLYEMPAEGLRSVAQTLANSDVTKELGQALSTAIENGDTMKRSAVLFSIMQNPAAREAISPALSEDKDSGK